MEFAQIQTQNQSSKGTADSKYLSAKDDPNIKFEDENNADQPLLQNTNENEIDQALKQYRQSSSANYSNKRPKQGTVASTNALTSSFSQANPNIQTIITDPRSTLISKSDNCDPVCTTFTSDAKGLKMKVKKGNKYRIIQQLRLSTYSSPVEEWNFGFGGLVFYSNGKINGIEFKAGDVFVFTEFFLNSAVDQNKNYESAIHGKITYYLFNMLPSDPNLKSYLIEGFARRKGQNYEFKSTSTTARVNEYSNDQREMDKNMQKVLQKALDAWEAGLTVNQIPVIRLMDDRVAFNQLYESKLYRVVNYVNPDVIFLGEVPLLQNLMHSSAEESSGEEIEPLRQPFKSKTPQIIRNYCCSCSTF
ncbi:UNKNOWN [Stylonychia lemnae]|uniref:Uncharacterized protein n=1 Tax=Stylonychia lemnae TaxID=5949 RepID=A0A078B738_STYLE|nr:UNKNOWN [Stylonychia lemnae]|eukprot:CDW90330.1 UNKNOWN [Stylonychia lemnae]